MDRKIDLAKRVVGISAVIFGLCGIVFPLSSISAAELNSQGLGAKLLRTAVVIAIAAHLYLLGAGSKLCFGRDSRFLRHFFGLETIYVLSWAFVLVPLGSTGSINKYEISKILVVNAGFTCQIFLLFPLWGWLLLRR